MSIKNNVDKYEFAKQTLEFLENHKDTGLQVELLAEVMDTYQTTGDQDAAFFAAQCEWDV